MIKFDGKNHDLGGGMFVTRILPNFQKRTVGPFVFLDHMGPIVEHPNQNTDVRAHPHIGLSTLTYLFEGRIVHRDSTGAMASIEPGEVNWMTAGKGISHSERTHPDDKNKSRSLHGLQFWIALPRDQEECEPSFIHYEKNHIPLFQNDQYSLKLIAGEAFGLRSPVKVSSSLIFAEIKAQNDSIIDLSELNFEVAIYVISGLVKIDVECINERQVIIIDNDHLSEIRFYKNAHFVIIGGKPLDEPRHLFWNFVSSSKERIERAKTEWRERTFPMVPGESEFIPLPESKS